MSGTSSPEAVKKLLENMQSDLRALSLECKKKFPPVKEVSTATSEGAASCLGPGRPVRRPQPACFSFGPHLCSCKSVVCSTSAFCTSRLRH
jgi:hypothetical protein